MKNSFVFYNDWAETLLTLPDPLRLKVYDAIMRYALFGEEPNEAEVMYSLFPIIRKLLDKDAAKYQLKCEKNKSNIEKRWEKKYERIRPNTKHTDNENDNDNDNDNVCIYNEETTDTEFELSIEERKKLFQDEISYYLEHFGKEHCNSFFLYWTELNRSSGLMRYEMEETWDTLSRLHRWKTPNNP